MTGHKVPVALEASTHASAHQIRTTTYNIAPLVQNTADCADRCAADSRKTPATATPSYHITTCTTRHARPLTTALPHHYHAPRAPPYHRPTTSLPRATHAPLPPPYHITTTHHARPLTTALPHHYHAPHTPPYHRPTTSLPRATHAHTRPLTTALPHHYHAPCAPPYHRPTTSLPRATRPLPPCLASSALRGRPEPLFLRGISTSETC